MSFSPEKVGFKQIGHHPSAFLGMLPPNFWLWLWLSNLRMMFYEWNIVNQFKGYWAHTWNDLPCAYLVRVGGSPGFYQVLKFLNHFISLVSPPMTRLCSEMNQCLKNLLKSHMKLIEFGLRLKNYPIEMQKKIEITSWSLRRVVKLTNDRIWSG